MNAIQPRPSSSIENQNRSPTTSLSRFIAKSCLCAGAGHVYNAIIPKINGMVFSRLGDSCISFPKYVYTFSKAACHFTMAPPFWKGSFEHIVLRSPILEELTCRVLLQDLLLKKLPKALLRRFAPSYLPVVDALGIRIARVFISTAFFSLAHAQPEPYCSSIKLANSVVLGSILGTIQEYTDSPILPILFHCSNNLQAVYQILNTLPPHLANYPINAVLEPQTCG